MNKLPLGLLLCTLGCDASPPSASLPPPAAPSQNAQRAALDDTFGAYESARALLAKDSVVGLDKVATRLGVNAKAAQDVVPEALKASLKIVEEAAATLARMPMEDLDAVRKQFGEVSRGLVQLLVLDPRLRPGRWVFECPMAQGYQKWVQVSDRLENPYMGSAMLECGALVRL